MRINPDAAKIRDNKKIRHLFYIISHFFLQNQNIHRIFAERIYGKRIARKSCSENIGD